MGKLEKCSRLILRGVQGGESRGSVGEGEGVSRGKNQTPEGSEQKLGGMRGNKGERERGEEKLGQKRTS